MKIQLKTIAIFTLAGLSGSLLLYTSQAVQDAEQNLRQSRAAIAQESEEIKMLRTEWAFLSAPERIQKIAEEYLDLELSEETPIIPSLEILREAPNKAKAQNASYPGASQ